MLIVIPWQELVSLESVAALYAKLTVLVFFDRHLSGLTFDV